MFTPVRGLRVRIMSGLTEIGYGVVAGITGMKDIGTDPGQDVITKEGIGYKVAGDGNGSTAAGDKCRPEDRKPGH